MRLYPKLLFFVGIIYSLGNASDRLNHSIFHGSHVELNGEVYVGTRETGFGLFEVIDGRLNGSVYIGEFRYNKKMKSCVTHGKGILILKKEHSVYKYIGEFANGKLDGKVKYYNDGYLNYIGEYKDGKKHGIGVWYTDEFTKLEAEWSNGKANGYGKYTSDIILYEGRYNDGKYHGWGKLEYLLYNFNTYEGEFINGKKTGFGKNVDMYGGKYVGEFLDDKKNGQGIMTEPGNNINSNGFIYPGVFINDEHEMNISEEKKIEYITSVARNPKKVHKKVTKYLKKKYKKHLKSKYNVDLKSNLDFNKKYENSFNFNKLVEEIDKLETQINKMVLDYNIKIPDLLNSDSVVFGFDTENFVNYIASNERLSQKIIIKTNNSVMKMEYLNIPKYKRSKNTKPIIEFSFYNSEDILWEFDDGLFCFLPKNYNDMYQKLPITIEKIIHNELLNFTDYTLDLVGTYELYDDGLISHEVRDVLGSIIFEYWGEVIYSSTKKEVKFRNTINYEYSFKEKLDLNTLLYDYEKYFKILPSNFVDSIEAVKLEVYELDKIFMNKLNENLSQFFLPYEVNEFVKTGTQYDQELYAIYQYSGLDPSIAKEFSKVSVGYNENKEINRYASVNYKHSYKPTWDEIKQFYGGITGLMEAGVSKEDLKKFELTYNVEKIEFNNDPNDKNKYVCALYMSIYTRELGKEYHKDLINAGDKLKIIGEVELIGIPFHQNQYNNNLKFKCTFPPNPSGKEEYIITDIKSTKSSFYKDYKKLYELYWNELEPIIDKIPYLNLIDDNNYGEFEVFFTY